MGDDQAASADSGGPLLISKMTPPELPSWIVRRSRIDKCIDKGLRRGMMTIISGPPGAGKSIALAVWLAGRRWPGPVAWLTVDEYDNQPGLFWRHLSAALQLAGIPVPAGGGTSADGQDPDQLLGIASALAAQQPPAVLILDNLHLLHEPGLASGLCYVLQHAKPGLRVIVSSRTDQPLPLHQYLLTGDLTQISADQLTFTGPECKLLLEKHGVTAYSESLMSLARQTEGWAAGLRFVAIGLCGRAEEAAESLSAAEQAITAYLTTEVFDPQPADVADFLLRTSVPDVISSDLAAALTDSGHGAVTLSGLVRANTFIQPTGGGWYRYHPLFAEVLRAMLQDQDPGLTAALQRRAAVWFRQRGQVPDAAQYAVRSGDWQLAARIVVDDLAVTRLLDPYKGQVMAASLQRVPPGAKWAQPQPFLVAAAVALASQDHHSSAAWLDRADDLLRQQTIDHELPSRLAAALIRFELAQGSGDQDVLYSAATEAEAVLGRMPAGVRAQHAELTVRVVSDRGGAALALGRLDEAGRILADAAALPLPAAGAAELAAELATCAGRLAVAEALRGGLVRAAELASRGLAYSAAASGNLDEEPPPNVPADIALAWVHLERNDLAQVRVSLKRAEAGLRIRRDRVAAALAALVAARLYLAEGGHAAAIRILSRARQGWSPAAWLDRRLTLAEARAHVMAGDIQAALDAADRCGGDSMLDAAVVRAQARVAAGDLKALGHRLHHAFKSVVDEPGNALDPALLDALLLDAQIHYANGDRAAGRRSLARALRLGRGEDVRLPFTLERAWILPVLRTDAELAQSYQALFQPTLADRGRDAVRSLITRSDEPAVVEPLTEREQEVLKYVAQLLSTAEIANELYISVNTVKTHLKSVHRKLAVAHRREAVRRARELKLL